jgi:hypothetical protein
MITVDPAFATELQSAINADFPPGSELITATLACRDKLLYLAVRLSGDDVVHAYIARAVPTVGAAINALIVELQILTDRDVHRFLSRTDEPFNAVVAGQIARQSVFHA